MMGDQLIPLPKGVLTVRFSGGPRDGESLTRQSGSRANSDAELYWRMTRGGTSKDVIVMPSAVGRETIEAAKRMTQAERAHIGQLQVHQYAVDFVTQNGDDAELVLKYAGLR
jgi:hypothetical protein